MPLKPVKYRYLRALDKQPNKTYTVKKRLVFLFVAVLAIFGTASAQRVGLKTNLVSDALLSPNLGIEVGLKPHWSLDVTGELNLWTIDGHKWKHWLVQPEARYWFCEYFAKHFIGIHAIGGRYNFGNIENSINFLGSDLSQLSHNRYQGWGIGGGIAYGYSFLLHRNWNLELEIGVGAIYTKYDEYQCRDCGKKVGSDDHLYLGPTKAAINLVYVF